jgi:hypothetical protein
MLGGGEAASHSPCVRCGLPTEADDDIAICDACVREFQEQVAEGGADGGDAPHPPSTPATEAQLRKLLDDW